NRDLTTFSVDLHRGIELLQKAPEGVIRVSESGISSADDLHELQKNGIHSALIGEHFMRESEPGEGVSKLLDGLHEKMATPP
ncbi:MAG: indole-3-glycerol-phosphate synthase, partial [Balneolaceae bacterium]